MSSYQFNFNMMTSRLPNKINNNFSKQKLSSQLDYQASSTKFDTQI